MAKKVVEKTAFHEAEHAVVARALGVGVTYVVMFPVRENSSASTKFRSPPWTIREQETAQRIRAGAFIALAGPVAEHRVHPIRNPRRAWATIWASDYTNAQACLGGAWLLEQGIAIGDKTLADFPRDEFTALFDWGLRETAKIVADNWGAIERVARALLREPLLGQAELDTLIFQSGSTSSRSSSTRC
jgi:hypothetical protein